MKLFSYVLRFDDGAAPNPYGEKCTLAICKPAIRRKVEKGDWVVGTGSANSPIGNISKHVVYAMKVSLVMTLKEYDTYCKSKLKSKIPNWNGPFEMKVGDCIYDYLNGEEPKIRGQIHGEQNRDRDLGGKNVLLAEEFYYFGDNPISIPAYLHKIIKTNQGHKKIEAEDLINDFIQWISKMPIGISGTPQMKEYIMSMKVGADCSSKCSEDFIAIDGSDEEETIC